MTEPTIKQWKRRALAAESELVALRAIAESNYENTRETVRENCVLRVALREIQESSNWAHGAIADKLGEVK